MGRDRNQHHNGGPEDTRKIPKRYPEDTLPRRLARRLTGLNVSVCTNPSDCQQIPEESFLRNANSPALSKSAITNPFDCLHIYYNFRVTRLQHLATWMQRGLGRRATCDDGTHKVCCVNRTVALL